VSGDILKRGLGQQARTRLTLFSRILIHKRQKTFWNCYVNLQ
jgi:hypothetical protein